MSQAAYYQKYYPRYDKYDGSFIKFKNLDFYLLNDFNSRDNLRAWLAKVDVSEAKSYVCDYLARRKERKQLEYAPSQVELRSLPIPGIVYLNTLFGNYYQECAKLGFKIKYNQQQFIMRPKKFSSSHRIIIDTREQAPLSFSIKTKSEALPFGDYRLNDDIFTNNCVIERKSMGDFYGTMQVGFDRFCREIDKAVQAKANLVIIVEGSFDDTYKYAKVIESYTHKYISPEYVFHHMREIIQKYPSVQFVFVNGRKEASRVIEKIFCSDGEYCRTDLQLLYDLNQL